MQRFEYTHELAWDVMKDYASYQESSDCGFERRIKEAFQLYLITDGHEWMDKLVSRIKVHIPINEETAKENYFKISNVYFSEFLAFRKNMTEIRIGKQNNLLDKY